MSEKYAQALLRRELAELTKSPPEGFSVGLTEEEDLFKWSVLIIGPPDTLFAGGLFKALLEFPKDFPNTPPVMRFTSPMFHPNIYPDGRVCISILHPPGIDPTNELESAEERWRPVLGVEQIIVSVISMLSEPNISSPADTDASVMFRDDYEQFKARVRRIVRLSQEEC